MGYLLLIARGMRDLRSSCVSWHLQWLGLAAALLMASAARGQAGLVSAPPADVETALHRMADRADVIFVGQVTAVRRVDGGSISSGVVEVEFQVEQAVRGCTAGVPYVLREWAGLWEGDDQRYGVGRRLLMLLHEPGAAGMSSPVDGLDGAIPVVRGGTAGLGEGTSARQAPPAVDLRWVGIGMLQTVSYRSEPVRIAHPARMASPGIAQATIAQAKRVPALPGDPVSNVEAIGRHSVPSQQASVDAVVEMLTSWQKEQKQQRDQHASR